MVFLENKAFGQMQPGTLITGRKQTRWQFKPADNYPGSDIGKFGQEAWHYVEQVQ
jgi:hypothetical protein